MCSSIMQEDRHCESSVQSKLQVYPTLCLYMPIIPHILVGCLTILYQKQKQISDYPEVGLLLLVHKVYK